MCEMDMITLFLTLVSEIITTELGSNKAFKQILLNLSR